MSYVVEHQKCPECSKHGRDRTGDNLAIYADGGAYCFSCGYYQSAKGSKRFYTDTGRNTKTLTIPSDCTDIIPQRGRDFLGKYGFSGYDIALNNILWSDYYQRLIFPIIIEGELLAWQGRYLGDEPKKAKWFSQGDIDKITYILGNPYIDNLILVEDILSAIKISTTGKHKAMPIFGSHISVKRLLTIKRFCGMNITIWLDRDKAKESMDFAYLARNLGMTARTVITEKDPKEYFKQEIIEILDK